MLCHKCDDRGAVRMNYREREEFEIGLCSCEKAKVFRGWIGSNPNGWEMLEKWFGVPIARIWPLEDLLDGSEPAPSLETSRDILVSAGKVERAGLGGKVKRK